jgi:hypothetical protein
MGILLGCPCYVDQFQIEACFVNCFTFRDMLRRLERIDNIVENCSPCEELWKNLIKKETRV